MKGVVDDSLRALLDITISATRGGHQHNLQVWVDTAFNGGLVIPRPRIEALGLKQASTTQAILADGSVVDLETFTAYLNWFGHAIRTQVVANDGYLPLLGTLLLDKRRLFVDYSAKVLSLD
jgi:clan AA aspartic protease